MAKEKECKGRYTCARKNHPRRCPPVADYHLQPTFINLAQGLFPDNSMKYLVTQNRRYFNCSRASFSCSRALLVITPNNGD
jgi:hypothetical protein